MAKPTKSGKKWRTRWIDENGKQQSGGTYDTYREADAQIKLHEAKVEEIKLGVRSPTPVDRTFNELCDYWLAKVTTQKRSSAADISMIRKHLRPDFGHLTIRTIGREQVDEYQAQRTHLDKKTVANHLTLLISMLNVAVELNWLIKAPKIKKPKVRMFSADYRYLKNAAEIERFLRAAFAEGEDVFMLYATAVYTGMRAGEVATLERGDINFDRRLITIQRSFDGPTKAADVRYVPILDALLPLLRSWCLKTSGKLLFPNEAGNMHQESARIFQETLHRVLDKSEFPRVQIKGKERRYIRFHDFRHTFASYWVMNSGDLFKLQKILGHKSMQMTMRYAHLAPDAFAADYDRFGTPITLSSATVHAIHSQS
jgi:integrase